MDDLVRTLKAAADNYYNGKPLIMDDDAYDALVEKLRAVDPTNPFLATIGAPVGAGAVALPYPMPSLDKVKPGQDSLTRFLEVDRPLLLTEKLDGLSALWIPESGRLYLRGDGVKGQDISHLVSLGIQGLVRSAMPTRIAVRGELVLSRTAGIPLARSWVNGVIHRLTPDPADVARIRFVAYDLLEPTTMTRSQGLAWLQNRGYEVPWRVAVATATAESLKAALLDRRSGGAYDTDGIVVAADTVPVRPVAGKNPKDMVAFKMPLSEQSAVTTLQEVLWAPSAQGYLVPRLRFDPVTIAGATIEFCTAHNARTVVDKGLGPGAQIRIRRSGDVIPTLDAVLLPGVGSLPPEGAWEWAGDEATAIHIRATTVTPAQKAARLQHFFKVLEIPSMGPANCEALVTANLAGIAALWLTPADRLGEVLGPKTGAALYRALRTKIPVATEMILMLASSTMPRGVGEAKLKSLFGVAPDWQTWRGVTEPPAGWTAGALQAFQAELGVYETWRSSELAFLGSAQVTTTVQTPGPAARGVLCFTGFRDKTLEGDATAAGFAITPVLTSKVTILVTPDAAPATEKVKKAAAAGKEILGRSAFILKYLGNN